MVAGGGGGGGGGQLFPPDLSVDVVAADSSINGFQTFTYSVQLRNVYYDSYTGVALSIRLPGQLQYISDNAASTSTTFTDTNSDGVPDRWNVGAFTSQQVKTLVITLRGRAIDAAVSDSLKATLSAYTGTDTQAGNNTDKIIVTIAPSPRLTIAKYANASTVQPGTDVTYTTLVVNAANAAAHAVQVEGTIDPHLYFWLNGGSPFTLQNNSSGVAIGTVDYYNGATSSWGYVPSSGAGGAPTGYDGFVTKWRILFTNTMAGTKSFEIVYLARVR